jgi:hypothetical protein
VNIVHIWNELPHRWEILQWRGNSIIDAINRTRRHKAVFLPDKEFTHSTYFARRICDQADILILHQDLWGDKLELIQHWKARGKTVIADLHLAVDSMGKDHPEYTFWTQPILREGKNGQFNSIPLTEYKWGLQLIDGATTSSSKIINECQSYTQVFHLPDFIDLEKYCHVFPENHTGITLGWKVNEIRQFQHLAFFEAIIEIINERDNIHLKVFSDELEISSFPESAQGAIEIIPQGHGKNWPMPMGMVDIGLIYTDFNLPHTSEIDILEWAAMKIPWVACKDHVFSPLRQFGCITDNSKESWKQKIIHIVDKLENYKARAKKEPYLYVIGQSLDENVQHLIGTYAKIINQSKEIYFNADNVQKLIRDPLR